ncbi:MAG: ABC transporter permease [Pseudomonadota bacterium]|nr:ABC transporter permease [Pseudomonadota bacterium]
MLPLIGRRLAMMALIMVVSSFLLYLLFEHDKELVAIKVLGQYSLPDQRLAWLEQNGYNEPFLTRYLSWLFNFFTGDLGTSIQTDKPVGNIVWPALANTAILAAWVFTLVVSISLVLGVLAGIAEGSFRDRGISILAVMTTSVPEFASATFLLAIFVYWLDWLPGTSAGPAGWFRKELILPVAVLVIFNFGYYTRMVRASMGEVMNSQYVRTAILKGMPYKRVIMKHALRNAMIAPFTVMVLQINYLLSGVIVTEVVFAYDGFGRRLYEAAQFQDIYVVEACTMIAVALAVATQFISEIGYTYLNPRIRFS